LPCLRPGAADLDGGRGDVDVSRRRPGFVLEDRKRKMAEKVLPLLAVRDGCFVDDLPGGEVVVRHTGIRVRRPEVPLVVAGEPDHVEVGGDPFSRKVLLPDLGAVVSGIDKSNGGDCGSAIRRQATGSPRLSLPQARPRSAGAVSPPFSTFCSRSSTAATYRAACPQCTELAVVSWPRRRRNRMRSTGSPRAGAGTSSSVSRRCDGTHPRPIGVSGVSPCISQLWSLQRRVADVITLSVRGPNCLASARVVRRGLIANCVSAGRLTLAQSPNTGRRLRFSFHDQEDVLIVDGSPMRTGHRDGGPACGPSWGLART